MGVIFRNVEGLHRQLHDSFRHIRKAGDELHAVLLACFDKARYSDTRQELKAVMDNLTQARDLLDQAFSIAAKAQSDLTSLTGCDGSCTKPEED